MNKPICTDINGNPVVPITDEIRNLKQLNAELLEALQFIVNVAKGKANDQTRVIELRFEKDTLLTWLKNSEQVINKAI